MRVVPRHGQLMLSRFSSAAVGDVRDMQGWPCNGGMYHAVLGLVSQRGTT